MCSVDCLFFDICARFRCIPLQVSYTLPQISSFHFLRNSLPTRNESGICRIRVQQNWTRIRTRVNKVNLIPPAPSWITLQAYSGMPAMPPKSFPHILGILDCVSVAEWIACWTQAQEGPGSNRSGDAVG